LSGRRRRLPIVAANFLNANPEPAQHDAQLGIPLHLNHDLDVWGLRA